MAFAKLIQGRDLAKHGVRFIRDKRTEVPEAVARKLVKNPRFEVGGFDGYPDKEAGKEVSIKELSAKVREAIDRLDPDAEDQFTEDGRPLAAAVSKIAGVLISQEQVDKALEYAGRRSTVKPRTKKAAPLPQPTPIGQVSKRIKLKTEKKPEDDKSKTGDADKKDEDGSDPSTEVKITV